MKRHTQTQPCEEPATYTRAPLRLGVSLLPRSPSSVVPSRVFLASFLRATSYSVSATSLHFTALGQSFLPSPHLYHSLLCHLSIPDGGQGQGSMELGSWAGCLSLLRVLRLPCPPPASTYQAVVLGPHRRARTKGNVATGAPLKVQGQARVG